ncbi:MAG: M48 family metallopeptidase [Patescibacteria group bacterium]
MAYVIGRKFWFGSSLFLLMNISFTNYQETAPKKTVETVSSQDQKQDKNKPKIVKKNKRDDPDEIGNRDVGRGINLYSIEKEIAMGKQMAQEIARQIKVVEDPIISEYVNRLGQNLVRSSDAKVPFTIKVIDAEEINAFALPGGFLFVNTGLILAAESEAELAGVMAHEIAHVAARHGTRQASRGQIANLATIPLIFMGGWGGYGAQQAASILIPVTFLKFSRGFEEEADSLGLQYIYKAGYDPMSLIDFFEKLQTMEKRRPGTLSKIFSTHPMTEDRIKKNQKNIQKLDEKQEYVIDTFEFQIIKSQLEQMLNQKRPLEGKGGPTLRRSGSTKIDESDENKKETEKDERPTLKRRN